MRQQNIVWIQFPYSDLQETKVRPGIILSNDRYNKVRQDVLVCALTSNLEKEDYSFFIDASNLEYGTLPIKSKIRVDKTFLIEKKLILQTFARLNDRTYDVLIDILITLIKRRVD